MVKFLSLMLFSILLPTQSFAASSQNLIIYTYRGFETKNGIGPYIAEKFSKICHCKIEFIAAQDAVGILNRIKLEGKNTKADIVIGLDNNIIEDAKRSNLFAPHHIKQSPTIAIKDFSDPYFIPFDYSYFAFIYNSDQIKNPPHSFEDLIAHPDEYKFIMSDPRLSTPALGLVLWVKKIYGDHAEDIWKKLRKNIITVTPSWGNSYDLLLKGETPMILGYISSPPANFVYNNNHKIKAALFKEGHYMQIEVAGLTIKGAKNPLARKFLEFLQTDEIQKYIPEHNWMLPAFKIPLPKSYDSVKLPNKPLIFPSYELYKVNKKWVNEWLNGMSQ